MSTETIYLRFTNEAEWITNAKAAGLYVVDPDTETELLKAYTSDHAIDVVGKLYNDDGVYGEDENGDLVVVTPPTELPGWHINFRGDIPEDWKQYEVQPDPPKRVFFN